MDTDRNLQAAIYESIKSSNSSTRAPPARLTPARPMSQRTTYNTLAREGIKPSLTPTFAGSNFGQAKSRRASNDQQRSLGSATENRILTGTRKAASFVDDGAASPLHLQRSQWISLSDGWFQTTPMGTGSSSRAGLHSVIESSMGQLYMCLYEPRTREATQACSHDPPEYDLEVSAKCMKCKDVGFELIFAYKSPTDFAAVICDISTQQWRLVRTCGSQEMILAAIDATDLKLHTFYSLLLQIRGSSISLDINATPVFTSLRVQEGSLTGLIGIKVKVIIECMLLLCLKMLQGSQIAIKGWKIRPVGKSVTRHSPTRVRSLKESLKDPPRAGASPVPAGGGGPGAPLSYTPAPAPSGISPDIQGALEQRHGRGITEIVLRDVVTHDLGVTFESIAALGTAKRLLNEAIVLPIIMPEFFTGIREPWKGVLLFGPPGTGKIYRTQIFSSCLTGKTLLAKAVANVNNATFYSCSAASLISKYRGESEKIVKCLFEAARLTSPSIIFLDEVDALVSSRSADEHEASRRLKTEFFSQMDGIASSTVRIEESYDVVHY